MKKINIILFFTVIFGFVLIRDVQGQTPITVPSASSTGYMLVSTTSGRYIATTTDPAHFGSVFATSTTATSTFRGGIKVTGGLQLTNITGATNCVQFDTNGNLTEASAACGSGGGGSGVGWTWNDINLLRMTTTTDDALFGATATTSTAKVEVIGNSYISGSLGLGTTTPASKLSVQGGGYFGNNLFVGGALTSTSSSASTIPYASTTAVTATTASTTNLIVSGLTSALTITGADGTFSEYAGTSCTNQVITVLSVLGAATCSNINNDYWSGADLTVANGGTGVSTFTSSQLLYGNGTNALSSVATTSLTATSPLSLSQPISVIGSSASALSISTAGDWTGTLDTIEGASFLRSDASDSYTSGTLTFDAGTRITSNSNLYATFNYASTTMITATTASTTNLTVSALNAANCDVKSTNGVFSCGTDATGGGGGSGIGWTWNDINSLRMTTTTDDALLGATATTSTAKLSVHQTGTNPAAYFLGNVGIGTTTPSNLLSVHGGGYFGNNLFVGGILTSTSSAASTIPYASTTAITATTASTTNLIVSGLTSALTITGGDGTFSEYTGSSCTNQFVRSVSALGVATCASINNGDWSGTDLSVANGGTGLSTFGGTNFILYTTSADTLSSEAAFLYDSSVNRMTVDYASTTAITVTGTASSTNLTVSALNAASCDVKSTNGVFSCGTDSEGTAAFPFTVTSNFGQTANSTTTALWMRGSPFSFSASSTAVFANASTTQLTVTGALYDNANAIGSNNNVLSSTGSATAWITCTTLTGSADLCDGDDATGGGGGGGTGWASTTDLFSIYFNGRDYVGIGTTTPEWGLHLASSTGPQLALSDGSLTSNHWTMRSINSNLYFATSSPTTFATSSVTALTINSNGNIGIGTMNPTGKLEIGSGQIILPNGALAAPTLTNSTSKNSGIFFTNVSAERSDVTMANNGVYVFFARPTQVLVTAGSANVPGLTDITYAHSGLFWPSANTLAFNNTTVGEMARFNSIGRFGIATTTPWRGFSVATTVAMSNLTTAVGTPNSMCIDATTKEVYENPGTSCTVSTIIAKKEIKPISETNGFIATTSEKRIIVKKEKIEPRESTTTVETITIDGLTAELITEYETTIYDREIDILSTTTGEVIGTTTEKAAEWNKISTTTIPFIRNIVNYATTTPVSILSSIIAKLNPVAYVMKVGGDPQVGFIAEEVETVDPRLVSRDEYSRPWSVRYEQLTAYIVKGMQELIAKITGQEERINALEARIITLEQRLGI